MNDSSELPRSCTSDITLRAAQAIRWICEGHQPDTFDSRAQAIIQRAIEEATAARGDAEPVAWMVGRDPQSAATYNAGAKQEAFDAARRWVAPIVPLYAAPPAQGGRR